MNRTRNILWTPNKRISRWIYHNPILWLISFSDDWETWMTIADKNLWATQVYTFWDTMSQTNCWNFYQWWNNYWFPFTWPTNTSSTKVDTTWYWPWNYYSSSTFITSSSTSDNWSTVNNTNLWWFNTWNVSAMQWPCPSWFHVLWTVDEWNQFQNILTWLWLWDWTVDDISRYLCLPACWLVTNTWVVTWWWYGFYYTTFAEVYQLGMRVAAFLFLDLTIWWDVWWAVFWMPIRPFANTPVTPDRWWEILYQP